MTLFLRLFAIFMVLTLATTIMSDLFAAQFGEIDYWQKRGPFFLIFITFFPRLTLLFSSVVTGGFLWWLGFFFLPRVLVATLATAAYWKTNPGLVTMSWFVAIFGEILEKWKFTGPRSMRQGFQFNVYRGGGFGGRSTSEKSTLDDKNVFEAEFTKKEE